MHLSLSFKPWWIVLCLCVAIFACRKENKVILSGNEAPYHEPVATVLVQNYVNRMYIDLIGREPLDTEMLADVQYLQDNDLSEAARVSLVIKLQTDTSWIEGDTSYQKAYYNRFYISTKSRMIEGASQDYINTAIGLAQGSYNRAIIDGDSVGAANSKLNLERLKAIIAIENNFRNGVIDIEEVFAILLNNSIYDFINMNTFNFIRATFDDLF